MAEATANRYNNHSGQHLVTLRPVFILGTLTAEMHTYKHAHVLDTGHKPLSGSSQNLCKWSENSICVLGGLPPRGISMILKLATKESRHQSTFFVCMLYAQHQPPREASGRRIARLSSPLLSRPTYGRLPKQHPDTRNNTRLTD